MRLAGTLGDWARREALLLSFLGSAAAFFVLAVSLGVDWMRTVGVIVAFVGAIIRTLIGVARAKVQSEGEAAKLERRTLVPIAPISSIDPTAVGVDAAAQTILPGEEVPEYLPREIDDDLQRAIRAALDGEGRPIVVAIGKSKVGKSRAMFEALLSCTEAADCTFVAPVDAAALTSILTPGETPVYDHSGSILWLDDLEPFINEGVTLQTLREWSDKTPGRTVIVATYGGKGSEKVKASASDGLATIAGEVFQHASEVPIRETNSDELLPLRGEVPQDAVRLIEIHGLAAYLVSAPELQRKLNSHRHAIGEPECPEGVAVVRATVDWARCGRTDPLPEAVLRDRLWPSYLSPGVKPTAALFAAGTEWALRPVAGSIALLEGADGFRAYDYVVSLIAGDAQGDAPKEQIWTRAIEGVGDAQAFGVGVAAFLQARTKDAIAAFEIARRSSTDTTAAIAGFNLGVGLVADDRIPDAIAVYDEVVLRYAESEEPVLRMLSSQALVNKGFALGLLDKSNEAIEVYDDVVSRIGESEAVGLKEQVAMALFNKGVRLGLLGEPEAEVAAYSEVVARFSGSEATELREQVASALFNKGTVLGLLDREPEAIADFDEIAARYGTSREIALREQVAKALFNKGVALAKLDRNDEALAAYDDVAGRFAESPEPALRSQAARALVNKGATLGQMDRSKEAIAIYDDVVSRFAESEEPAVQEHVARALFNKCIRLNALGRFKEALPIYDDLVSRFGQSEEPALRAQAARSLFNKGTTLATLDRHGEELQVYSDVVSRFGESDEITVREQVAKALFNKGARLRLLERSEEAVAVYEEVESRFGESDEDGLRRTVALALCNKGVALGMLDREEDEMAAYDEVVSRFEGAENVELREQAGKALFNKGVRLKILDRRDEAGVVFDQLAVLFQDAEEPGLQELVAKGLQQASED